MASSRSLLLSLLVAVFALASAQTSLKKPPFVNFLGFNRRRVSPIPFGRTCSGSDTQRTYSGYCNNKFNPLWGSARTKFVIKSTHVVHNLNLLPNARKVSNLICRETGSVKNKRGMSELVTFFGQFIDHTVTETENGDQSMPIAIPADDPVFTAGGNIPFFRTITEGKGLAKSPVNSLSSFVDAASVYGTNEKDALKLRTKSGGKMKLDAAGLLTKAPNGFFVSGDKRANENPVLTSLHTIWTREHNVIADEVTAAFPELATDDEAVYQLARLIVGAELQAVTWHEFLPAILGRKLGKYQRYKSFINPGISTEFSTCAFRVGHTLINGKVTSIAGGKRTTQNLRDVFFSPGAFVAKGVDAYMRGITKTKAAEIDAGITEDVRDFLLNEGRDRKVQLDLAALNIQRGRDHRLPSYNMVRGAYRLRPALSFADITSKPALQAALKEAYGTINRVDAWIGGVSEDHKSGSLGELFGKIWADEFTRLRDGDRFYFEKKGLFTEAQISKIPSLNALVGNKLGIGKVMRKVIIRNTGLSAAEVQANPFFV